VIVQVDTRIIKVGNRLGDNADMAMIELVDFNELYNGGKKKLKKLKAVVVVKLRKQMKLLMLQLLKKQTTLLNN
jgi:large subunit ribosomal protein L17